MTPEESEDRAQQERKALLNKFMDKLDVDEEVAHILIEEGFSGLEEVAYVPEQELLDIEAFNEEIVEELRTRARNALLSEALAYEQLLQKVSPELQALEGLESEVLAVLAENDICTLDDLAELATDELCEMTDIPAEKASELIMSARAHWFDEQPKE